jgi:hypothetical protein
MRTYKPSTKLHEVVDHSYRFTMIVHTGSQSNCLAWVQAQPAQKRQDLEVRVATR